MDKHDKESGMAVAAVSPATATLKRNIGPLSIVGLGMSICNGWAAMSSTIVVGLSQGGTSRVCVPHEFLKPSLHPG
jgi:choline transport protein